jgi:uncharacterized membrane protein
MAALVCVTTLLIQIPIPATDGFFNVGDGMIMVAALTFGPVVGAIAGGLGSALADFAGGWFVWILPTLIIKGLEGLIAGRIRQSSNSFFVMVVAWLIGGLEMVTGYFLVQVYLYGFSAALIELPFNFVQMAIGGVIGIPIAQIVQRLRF